MAYNGSGTFVRVHNWVTDHTNVVPVTDTRMDAEMDGMATGLSTCVTKDGQTTATARIPFALGTSSMDGSVSSASYAHVSDLNTGLYFPAADQWGLTAGGVGTLTSTATAITGGTGVTLTLSGALTVSSGGLVITGNSTVTGTLDVSGNFAVATNKFTVAAASGNTLVAGTLDVTGNTVMAGRLTIPDGTAASPAIRQTAGASDAGMYFIADDQIGFSTAGVLRTSVTTTALTTTGQVVGATAGGTMIATQAEQETGTATDKLVTSGRQHFHPGAAKAWAKFAADGTVAASYNITGVVKDSVGDWTVTIANDFSSADYVVLLSVIDGDANTEFIIKVRTQAAGTFTIKCVEFDAGGFPDADPDAIYFACYGDL